MWRSSMLPAKAAGAEFDVSAEVQKMWVNQLFLTDFFVTWEGRDQTEQLLVIGKCPYAVWCYKLEQVGDLDVWAPSRQSLGDSKIQEISSEDFDSIQVAPAPYMLLWGWCAFPCLEAGQWVDVDEGFCVWAFDLDDSSGLAFFSLQASEAQRVQPCLPQRSMQDDHGALWLRCCAHWGNHAAFAWAQKTCQALGGLLGFVTCFVSTFFKVTSSDRHYSHPVSLIMFSMFHS